MGTRARTLAHPGAVEKIAELCAQIAQTVMLKSKGHDHSWPSINYCRISDAHWGHANHRRRSHHPRPHAHRHQSYLRRKVLSAAARGLLVEVLRA